MAFEEHPAFVAPAREATIWRYMDLPKYLSLLETKSLYFVRLDRLGEFDLYEGYYTKQDSRFDKTQFGEMSEEWKEASGVYGEALFKQIQAAVAQMKDVSINARSRVFVSSWVAQEHESAAMWRAYVSTGYGIAVRSTFQRLVDSLAQDKEFTEVIGLIKYIDFDTDSIPVGNVLNPFIHKRKNFDAERELRALIWTPRPNEHKGDVGLYVEVDLEILVDRIYVAPSTPTWIRDLVKSVSSKYDLDKEITQSDLDSTPLS